MNARRPLRLDEIWLYLELERLAKLPAVDAEKIHQAREIIAAGNADEDFIDGCCNALELAWGAHEDTCRVGHAPPADLRENVGDYGVFMYDSTELHAGH